ncbi:STAS domain-containing protein [Mycobacterium sp.]|uniref:STAS domain-containing protein n=1 Tax=unclassified Mycobacterium TaxID=2642494 RepID=UPI0031E215EB
MREHGRHQTTVVTISGEVDAADSDRVREFASRPILVGNPLILDLSGVKFFAARAILTLIALDDACRVTAVPWAIVPSPTVNRVLRLTDCATSLPTASSVPEALHQLTTGTCC